MLLLRVMQEQHRKNKEFKVKALVHLDKEVLEIKVDKKVR